MKKKISFIKMSGAGNGLEFFPEERTLKICFTHPTDESPERRLSGRSLKGENERWIA